MNRKETITSVTIRNRLDCCGERLENLEIRAGTTNDNANEILGRFKGPSATFAKHVIQFIKSVVADILTFQLKKNDATLQINGIYLNEMPVLGKNHFQIFSFQFLGNTKCFIMNKNIIQLAKAEENDAVILIYKIR